MKKIECRNCSTPYYTAATYHHMPCPRCHDHAGMRELTRRILSRTALREQCAVRKTGQCVSAETVDL